MARTSDRNRAVELRKLGHSYSQIKSMISVNKSTLSYWLKDHPLSNKRIRELRDWSEKRIESYKATVRRRKEKRLDTIYKKEKAMVFPLSQREFFLAGLFLYWGEGSKTKPYNLTMTNTDPAVARFFIKWLSEIFDVSKDRLRVSMHLYADMDPQKEMDFWCEQLGIGRNQFLKPYIKKSRAANLTRKGGFGHGTCSVRIGNARLAEKVFAGLKVIRDHFTSTGQ